VSPELKYELVRTIFIPVRNIEFTVSLLNSNITNNYIMSLSRYRYAESVGSSEVIIFRVSGFVIIMQQRYFTAAINTESLEFSFIFTGNTLRVIIC